MLKRGKVVIEVIDIHAAIGEDVFVVVHSVADHRRRWRGRWHRCLKGSHWLCRWYMRPFYYSRELGVRTRILVCLVGPAVSVS
jgi:hypothetical protein